jgi:uncharacterized protein YegP (UPF0339 family)
MQVIVFKGKNKEWRWHLRAGNGKLVATSGESFHSKGNALRAAKAFLRNLFKAMQSTRGVPVGVSDD